MYNQKSENLGDNPFEAFIITLSLKEILKVQLFWYLTNILVLLSQNYLYFELPYLDNLYILTFKIIGSSIFIAILLYWTTMKYDLNFYDLGINFNYFMSNLNLGLKLSFLILVGVITIQLTTSINLINPLIQIVNAKSLNSSILYFILLFFFYLIPAFSKELFYRGFIYYYFKNNYGLLIGSILSVIYYTCSYLDPQPSALSIHLLMGIITNYLYEKTDSLVSSTILQASYQASLSLYLFSFDKWPF